MSNAANMVQAYTDAEELILQGSTVQWGNRQLGMPDLEEVRRGRREWERRLAAEQRGSRVGVSVATFGSEDRDDG